ncbi:MAG TPA: amidohydrolase family protein [Phnomibacter sp.]|nr:amidohydrolase family protein [Phnomibacter sp.]
MKKILLSLAVLAAVNGFCQETVYPAKEYKGLLFLKGGTVHVGNGEVIENATVKISNGKIEAVGKDLPIPQGDAKVIDVAGKHVYPGLILPASSLGLQEYGGGVRGSNDFAEIGENNASVRSIAAYNADSKITNTLRSNGILLANVMPQGNVIGGLSSVVQLDAWNYEDAGYAVDNGVNYYMPSLLARAGGGRRGGFGGAATGAPTDPVKQALDQIAEVKQFFQSAKAWNAEATHASKNLQYEAVKPLFEKKQKLYIHANQVNQMLVAVDFAKEFGFDVVIVGGAEAYRVADLLKQSNVSVVLSQMHNLPTSDDDDVDQPYKAPAALQKAGVLYCINDDDPQNRGRNLAFNAGTAAAYGLSKEEALTAITLNAAKILGIADRTGSIEAGKDANIVVSEGDILDMRTNIISHAFIQARTIELVDKHKLLYERYKYKYSIK